MKTLKQLLLWCASVVFVVLLHLATGSVLPYPWGYANAIIVFLILFLLLEESGVVVWIAFAAHFFVELYAMSPFGVILFSGTMSALAAFWLYRYFFTNQSWFTATALSFLTVVMYRLMYTVLLLIARIFLGTPLPPWRFLMIVYGWEIALTTLAAGMLYLAIARPFRRTARTLPAEWRI
jgi:hypothetical protein